MAVSETPASSGNKRNWKPMLCSFYGQPRGCSKKDSCAYVHMCKDFIHGKCEIDSCTRDHTISSVTHAILQQFEMDSNDDETCLKTLREVIPSGPDDSNPSQFSDPRSRGDGFRRPRGRERQPHQQGRGTYIDTDVVSQLAGPSGGIPAPENPRRGSNFRGMGSSARGRGTDQHQWNPGFRGHPRMPFHHQGPPRMPFPDQGPPRMPFPHQGHPGMAPPQHDPQSIDMHAIISTAVTAAVKAAVGEGTARGSEPTRGRPGPIPNFRSKNKEPSHPAFSMFLDKELEICTFDVGDGKCIHGTRCRYAHCKVPYMWQMKVTKGWSNTSEELNDKLERAFVKPERSIVVDGEDYDLMNMSMKPSTPLRRLCTPSATKVNLLYATAWTWFYQTDRGQWERFEPQGQQWSKGDGAAESALEKAFQDYIVDKTKNLMTYQISSFSYQLDFSNLTQKNIQTGTSRQIVRRPAQYVGASNLKELAESWKSARASEPKIKYPEPWDWNGCDNKEYALVALAVSSYEYKKVVELVWKSLYTTVTGIQRVQNMEKWADYQRKRLKMEKTSGTTCKEMSLFHGTDDARKCEAICSGGYDMRLAGTAVGTIYGKGTYFHIDASYSHDYCRSTGKMILTKVLVGDYTQGDRSMSRPPAQNSQDPFGRLYDSTVDNVLSPSIYVVYDNHQVYPAYVISFE